MTQLLNNRVSIIIPNHNYGQWLVSAIDSIINQDYRPLNVVVVDDASTDDSWNILCDLLHFDMAKKIQTQSVKPPSFITGENTDKNVKFFFTKHDKALGPSSARNSGIMGLWDETDIFGFLDADDYFLPNKISKSLVKLLEYDDIGMVYSDWLLARTEDDSLVREYRPPYDRLSLLAECPCNSNVLIRKEALQFTNGYDNTLRTCEDYDLWLRISEKFIMTHIPEALQVHRLQPMNATDTVKQETWNANYRRVFEKLTQRNNGIQ